MMVTVSNSVQDRDYISLVNHWCDFFLYILYIVHLAIYLGVSCVIVFLGTQ